MWPLYASIFSSLGPSDPVSGLLRASMCQRQDRRRSASEDLLLPPIYLDDIYTEPKRSGSYRRRHTAKTTQAPHAAATLLRTLLTPYRSRLSRSRSIYSFCGGAVT